MKVLIAFLPAMLALAIATPSLAQPGDDVPTGYLQYDYSHSSLSDGYADWSDHFIRLNVALTPKDTLTAELSNQRHFQDRGTFFGAGYTHTFNADWYGSIHAAGSNGGFFLPRLRLDGFLHRKWLANRQLITTLGFGYYAAKDGHIDRTLTIGARYYFASPFIFEAGAKLNQSDPGDVVSKRGYAALTYGQDKQQYIVLRFDAGREAYQLIGSGRTISDFASQEASLGWRKWWGKRFGSNLVLTGYHNPSYDRLSLQGGIFYDF